MTPGPASRTVDERFRRISRVRRPSTAVQNDAGGLTEPYGQPAPSSHRSGTEHSPAAVSRRAALTDAERGGALWSERVNMRPIRSVSLSSSERTRSDWTSSAASVTSWGYARIAVAIATNPTAPAQERSHRSRASILGLIVFFAGPLQLAIERGHHGEQGLVEGGHHTSDLVQRRRSTSRSRNDLRRSKVSRRPTHCARVCSTSVPGKRRRFIATPIRRSASSSPYTARRRWSMANRCRWSRGT